MDLNKIEEARKAVSSLFIGVDAKVATDVKRKIESTFSEFASAEMQLKNSIQIWKNEAEYQKMKKQRVSDLFKGYQNSKRKKNKSFAG